MPPDLRQHHSFEDRANLRALRARRLRRLLGAGRTVRGDTVLRLVVLLRRGGRRLLLSRLVLDFSEQLDAFCPLGVLGVALDELGVKGSVEELWQWSREGRRGSVQEA